MKEQKKAPIEENDKFNGETSISTVKLAEIIEQYILNEIDQEQKQKQKLLLQEESDKFNQSPLSYLMTEAFKILINSTNDQIKLDSIQILLRLHEISQW